MNVLASTFTKSLYLVLSRQAETSLMIWLYENDSIERAALWALADILH